MPRIRTIKPEFWTDEKTGTLPEFEKCLFLGMLNLADDYGVLEFAPTEWRAKIFPYHSDTTPGLVNRALVDFLIPRQLVLKFGLVMQDGRSKSYCLIVNFGRHQVVNKPSAPLLAGWEKGDTPETYANRVGATLQSQARTIPEPLPEPSGSTPEPLRPGKERKGEEEERGASLPSVATPLVASEEASEAKEASEGKKPRKSYPSAFEEFWLAWPTPKGQSKVAAYAQWERLSVEDRGKALTSLPAYTRWLDRKPDGRDYGKHCERWLRDRYFEQFLAQPTGNGHGGNVVQGPRGLPQTDEAWTEVLTGWIERRHWPVWCGPNPTTVGSKVPRHLYAKVGLQVPEPVQAGRKPPSLEEQRELAAGVKSGALSLQGPAPGQPGSLISLEIAREAGLA